MPFTTALFFLMLPMALLAMQIHHVKIKIASSVSRIYEVRAGCLHKIRSDSSEESVVYLSILKPDKMLKHDNYAMTTDGVAIVPIEMMHLEICDRKAEDGTIKFDVQTDRYTEPNGQVQMVGIHKKVRRIL